MIGLHPSTAKAERRAHTNFNQIAVTFPFLKRPNARETSQGRVARMRTGVSDNSVANRNFSARCHGLLLLSVPLRVPSDAPLPRHQSPSGQADECLDLIIWSFLHVDGLCCKHPSATVLTRCVAVVTLFCVLDTMTLLIGVVTHVPHLLLTVACVSHLHLDSRFACVSLLLPLSLAELVCCLFEFFALSTEVLVN